MGEHDAKSIERARCPGTSWDDLAAVDNRRVPDFLLGFDAPYLGSDPLPVDRYTDPEFFAREIARLWPNVWQFAAREEDMLEVGATVIYENAGRSYLLARQQDGSIRAFHNVCLHRGRRLRDKGGIAREFRCPFHSFTWNTDGTIKSIPCRWDFSHLPDEAMALPEAEVGRWGGYVFVRENSGGLSLEEYLAPLPEHFARWSHEECNTLSWTAKVVAANWKATAEAFMESFHVIATHPQILPFTGDANTKYAILGENVNLAITPFGVPSPHTTPESRDEQWIIDQFLKNNGRVVPKGVTIDVSEGSTARTTMGAYNRKRFGEMAGRDLDHISDAEAQDAFTYNVFPNFSPWGGFAPNLVYRWRPWPDQDHTLMEVRVLNRRKPGQSPAQSPAMTMLGADDGWESALGILGAILDQDMANLPNVQIGLKASKSGVVNLGDYQESRIRHFHQRLDHFLAGGR